MNVDTIPADIERLAAELPKFPDGRIDYHTAAEAPVLNIFVMYDGKLLLVKRGEKVGWLKGKWHIVAGFLDEMKTLREKAYEEMEEETGIARMHVKDVRAITPFHEHTDKNWIVHPVLIELIDAPNIVLDWENTDFVWVDPAQIGRYDVVPSVISQLHRLGIVNK
jgi:ADP-ribose pyrophosphatase YjhB (NUDIX family)